MANYYLHQTFFYWIVILSVTCHSSTEICAKNWWKKSNWEVKHRWKYNPCHLLLISYYLLTSTDYILWRFASCSLGRKCCHNVICSKRVTQVIVLSSICSQILIMFFPLHWLLKKPAAHIKWDRSGLEIASGVAKLTKLISQKLSCFEPEFFHKNAKLWA